MSSIVIIYICFVNRKDSSTKYDTCTIVGGETRTDSKEPLFLNKYAKSDIYIRILLMVILVFASYQSVEWIRFISAQKTLLLPIETRIILDRGI